MADPEKFSNTPPRWLLLDSESTIDTISNKAVMSKIKKLEIAITIHYNAGSRQVQYTADLKGYRRIWYNQKSIANIISQSCSIRKYQVVFNSKDMNCFNMMLKGRWVVFNVSANELYHHNTVYHDILLINRVVENRKKTAQEECEGAKAVRRALG